MIPFIPGYLVRLGGAALVASALSGHSAPEGQLYNPYERLKNGPPLTGVFHKARTDWLLRKLREPRHHIEARMPEFSFSEEEALDVLAYLSSIAGEAPARAADWPDWADIAFDDMEEDDDLMEVMDLTDLGAAVWGNARCSICHATNGPDGDPIGGFVDLRVGGIDLTNAAQKLKRDWLYRWIEEPKDYFLDTLMPRFRLSHEDRIALVEFILRDEGFLPWSEEEEADPPPDFSVLADPQRATRGKGHIERARCVVCHDIDGIPEVLPVPERRPIPPAGTFEHLAYDVRCLTCHTVEGRGGTYAPDLSGEGSRLHEDWIATFLEQPDMIRPLSQQMPLLGLDTEEARAAATYMVANRRDSAIPREIPGGPVTPEEVQRGQESFAARGCSACHDLGDGSGGVVGPALDAVGDRLLPGYIWSHMVDPHAVNPYSAEPNYGLSDEECRALAAYLSTLKQ